MKQHKVGDNANIQRKRTGLMKNEDQYLCTGDK